MKGTAMGRPTKLTPQLQTNVVNLLKAGNWIETTCSLVGIDKQTHYNWINRAQAELNRLAELEDPDAEPDPDEVIYIGYLDATTQARAEAEARNVSLIQQAASGINVVKTKRKVDKDGNLIEETEERYVERDWRAALEYLERSNPKWSRKTVHEIQGRDGGPVATTGEMAIYHYHMPDNGRKRRKPEKEAADGDG